MIHCNEVEVVNTLMSNSTCDDSRWSTYWDLKRKVTEICLLTSDTASDYYQPQLLALGNCVFEDVTINI